MFHLASRIVAVKFRHSFSRPNATLSTLGIKCVSLSMIFTEFLVAPAALSHARSTKL